MIRIDPLTQLTIPRAVTSLVNDGLSQEQAVNAVAILNTVRRYTYIRQCMLANLNKENNK